MKSDYRASNRVRRGVAAVTILFAVGLFTIGCGEVVSVGDIVAGPNSLRLNWSAPTTNEDGSNLEDLAGYRVYYGIRPGQYSQVVTVGDITSADINNLADGTYYLAVTAYDMYGNESEYSDEIDYTF